jgi:hypothetical protein
VDSDDALNFFLHVFNHDSFALMRKFEQWSCIQDEGMFVFPVRPYCTLSMCFSPRRAKRLGWCTE